MLRARLAASLAFVWIGSLGCARNSQDPVEQADDPPARLLLRSVTLSRGACLGTCPVYSLTISAEGEVRWLGEHFVRTVCGADKRIDPAMVAPLFSDIAVFDFSEVPQQFRDPRCEAWGTDNPSAALSLTYADGRQQRVYREGGCYGNSAYQAMRDLEDRIDEVAGSEAWIAEPRRRCMWYPVKQYDADVFSSEYARQQSEMIYFSASELPTRIAEAFAADDSMRLRLSSHASVRDQPGASRARADAFMQAFQAAGGDSTRIEVVDCGTDLATLAADDEDIWRDERFGLEFYSQKCVERERASQ